MKNLVSERCGFSGDADEKISANILEKKKQQTPVRITKSTKFY